MFIVSKEEGKRPVVNYRQLNKVIRKDSTLIPRINNLIDFTGKARWFLKIDLEEAFHQILIKKKDE